MQILLFSFPCVFSLVKHHILSLTRRHDCAWHFIHTISSKHAQHRGRPKGAEQGSRPGVLIEAYQAALRQRFSLIGDLPVSVVYVLSPLRLGTSPQRTSLCVAFSPQCSARGAQATTMASLPPALSSPSTETTEAPLLTESWSALQAGPCGQHRAHSWVSLLSGVALMS